MRLKPFFLAISILTFTIDSFSQTVNVNYLNPTSSSSYYDYARFGTSSLYYAGFMYNKISPNYDDWDKWINHDVVMNECSRHTNQIVENNMEPSRASSISYSSRFGQMDAGLPQKVEELTVYVIEQQKEIQELWQENEEVKTVIEGLFNRIEKLKN